MIFLDTSALAKRYLAEPGSAAVRRFMDEDGSWSASMLARTEMSIVLCRAAGYAHTAEHQRLGDDWDRFTVVPLDAACLSDAASIGCRHRVRTSDAIHLAAALRVPAMTFLSFDARQLAAARALGLEVAEI